MLAWCLQTSCSLSLKVRVAEECESEVMNYKWYLLQNYSLMEGSEKRLGRVYNYIINCSTHFMTHLTITLIPNAGRGKMISCCFFVFPEVHTFFVLHGRLCSSARVIDRTSTRFIFGTMMGSHKRRPSGCFFRNNSASCMWSTVCLHLHIA